LPGSSSTVFINSFFVHFPDFPKIDSPPIPQLTRTLVSRPWDILNFHPTAKWEGCYEEHHEHLHFKSGF
jgi:hypothetical protein